MLLAFRAYRLQISSFRLRLIHTATMAVPRTGEKRELSPFSVSSNPDKKRRSNSPKSYPEILPVNGHTGKPGNSEKDKPRVSNKKQAKSARKRRNRLVNIEPGSHDDVYWREVISLLGQDTVDAAIDEEKDLESPFEFREEVELEISRLSSNGELLFEN